MFFIRTFYNLIDKKLTKNTITDTVVVGTLYFEHSYVAQYLSAAVIIQLPMFVGNVVQSGNMCDKIILLCLLLIPKCLIEFLLAIPG